MHRMIDTATWDDPWFAELEPDAKLVFLYLLTNRRSTAAGAFEITPRQMSFETGLDQPRIAAILEALHPRVQWWPAHQVVWIRNFFKHQAANDKFTISAQRHVADLPLEIQQTIATVYPSLVPDGTEPAQDTDSDANDTHGIPTGEGMDTHTLVKGSSRSSGEVGEKEKTPAQARPGADAPAQPSPPPTPPEPPKPRTPKQIESDRKHERRLTLYAAYCRGIGLDPDDPAAEVNQSRAFRDLKPIVDTPEPSPDDMERCTRFLTQQTWRDTPPSIPQVIGQYAGWVAKHKPDTPEPKDQPRATPSRNGTTDRSWRDKWRTPEQSNVIDVEVSR